MEPRQFSLDAKQFVIVDEGQWGRRVPIYNGETFEFKHGVMHSTVREKAFAICKKGGWIDIRHDSKNSNLDKCSTS